MLSPRAVTPKTELPESERSEEDKKPAAARYEHVHSGHSRLVEQSGPVEWTVSRDAAAAEVALCDPRCITTERHTPPLRHAYLQHAERRVKRRWLLRHSPSRRLARRA
ncbi:hypothetical protein O3G_MSEX000652 [Manduca sexta]|nr:hypothetical protein O3G_MSEX000652 [Manduca sexta]